MFFFARRRSKPDTQFPSLSRARADELRRVLREGFAARGFDIDFDGDILHLTRRDDGTDLTLSTTDLIQALAEDESPDAVPTWATAFIKAVAAVDTTTHLDTSDTYRAVRLLLLGDGTGTGIDAAERKEILRGIERSRLRRVADGLNLCLMLDVEEAVTPANVERVVGLDDLETIERAALNNARTELSQLDVDVDYQTDDDNTTGCWLLRAPGPYLASAPLLMDEFITRYVPGIDTDEGVLFTLPFPNVLFVREVATGEELAQALHILAAGTMVISDLARPRDLISPRVYLWHAGLIEAVSTVADDGGYVIEPNSYLLDRLQG